MNKRKKHFKIFKRPLKKATSIALLVTFVATSGVSGTLLYTFSDEESTESPVVEDAAPIDETASSDSDISYVEPGTPFVDTEIPEMSDNTDASAEGENTGSDVDSAIDDTTVSDEATDSSKTTTDASMTDTNTGTASNVTSSGATQVSNTSTAKNSSSNQTNYTTTGITVLSSSSLNIAQDASLISATSSTADKKEAIYVAFRESGMSHDGACALLGYIDQCSGFNSEHSEENSYGLCGWNDNTVEILKDYCEENDFKYNSTTGQIAFLLAVLERPEDYVENIKDNLDTAVSLTSSKNSIDDSVETVYRLFNADLEEFIENGNKEAEIENNELSEASSDSDDDDADSPDDSKNKDDEEDSDNIDDESTPDSLNDGEEVEDDDNESNTESDLEDEDIEDKLAEAEAERERIIADSTSKANNFSEKYEDIKDDYEDLVNIFEYHGSQSGDAVAEFACQFVGNPYVWGGESLTNGCDCSGFIKSVYAHFGVSLPHYSWSLAEVGVEVDPLDLQPGDIIVYDGHCSIYIGGGRIVHASNSAPYPVGGIKISNNYAFEPIIAIRRIFDSDSETESGSSNTEIQSFSLLSLEKDVVETSDDEENEYVANSAYKSKSSTKELEEERIDSEPQTFSSTSTGIFYDVEDAANAFREQLVNRDESITIEYQLNYDPGENYKDVYDSLFSEISDEAFKHTGIGNEGDYLAFQFKGYSKHSTFSKTDKDYTGYDRVTWDLEFTWYTTAEEEKEVTDALADVYASLDLEHHSDYEIVKAIYDYICSNVTYDYDHDSSYLYRYTAYAALIDKTAVCQGYMTLFYRMALDNGVDCRVITGDGHGWNIVKIGDLYYNVDTTWDSYNTPSTYQYFLCCDDDFYGHTRDNNFSTEEFYGNYPMALSNYDPETDNSEIVHVFEDWTVVKKATCYEPGEETSTCIYCDETSSREIPTTGHTETTIEGKEATCTEDGLTDGVYCSVCNEVLVEQEVIPSSGHSWDDGVVVSEATCTDDGEMFYTCTVCGETKTEIILATGHNAVKVEAVEPNEDEDGNIEYWYCETCGKYFSDELLENEISLEDTIIKLSEEIESNIENEKASSESRNSLKGDSVKTGEMIAGIIIAVIVVILAVFGLFKLKKKK